MKSKNTAGQIPASRPHQIIEYSNAACGSGKTEWAVQWMSASPGLYVYAVDRIEEFAVRTKRINEAARMIGSSPLIMTLQSSPGLSVTQEFPRKIATLGQFRHAILIITHAALKLVDHAVCDGWTLIVDEDPKLWVSDVIEVAASKPFWTATYNLTPLTDLPGYASISLKTNAPTFRDIINDALTKPVASLHDRIRRGGVTVKLNDWDDLTERLTWFSIFDVTELRPYDRVIILANSFDHLLTYRLIQTKVPAVELRPLDIARSQTWEPRNVVVNYVATDHTATVNHLRNTTEGQGVVRAWCKWVNGMVSAQSHYWCANKDFGVTDIAGTRISPKIAGSNAHRHRTECSVIYAAKASTNEARVFADLAGGAISFDDIRRDREFEDLIQIVFRSSLRVPDDDRTVTLNLYDIEQAEFIRDYFATAGFPFSISLHHHEIGAVKTRQKRGPKVDQAKPRQTASERAKAYRERQKARAA